jgi:hypothetical protein
MTKKIIKRCPNDPFDRVINPKTLRSVMINNKDIKNLLNQGYILEEIHSNITDRKIIQKCSTDSDILYIHPFTCNCVIKNNKDIQKLLNQEGYILEEKELISTKPMFEFQFKIYFNNDELDKSKNKLNFLQWFTSNLKYKLLDINYLLSNMILINSIVTESDISNKFKNVFYINTLISLKDEVLKSFLTVDTLRYVFPLNYNKYNINVQDCSINLNSKKDTILICVPKLINTLNNSQSIFPFNKEGLPCSLISNLIYHLNGKITSDKSTQQSSINSLLDTNKDGFISINEYLASKVSLGPHEKRKGQFKKFDTENQDIKFLLILINRADSNIKHIACIPNYFICIYQNIKTKKYFAVNSDLTDIHCNLPENIIDAKKYYGAKHYTYAMIYSLNTPLLKKDHLKTKRKLTFNETDIIVPPNLREIIDRCKEKNKKIVICSLGLIFTQDILDNSVSGHANVLIFDIVNKIIERFDPQINDPLNIIDQNKLDTVLKNKFFEILPDYRYKKPNEICPYIGPQGKADAFTGLCLTWSTMYMLLRVLNSELTPEQIVEYMLQGSPKELLNKILRFQKFMITTLQNEKVIKY